MSPTKLVTTIHYSVPGPFKEYMQNNRDIYLLVFGGGKQKLESINDKWLLENCMPDDICPKNISHLNPILNEMTTVFLVRSNLRLLPASTANIGHVHYRRFFSREDLEDIDKCDGIIAEPISLTAAGFPCTVEEQYSLFHYEEDFQTLKRLVIEEGLYDEEAWGKWSKLQMLFAPCNMFCLKREVFNMYCDDVFKVILRLPDVIDLSGRDDYQKRACSFMSERLTSYWMYAQQYRQRMKWIQKPCQFKPEWKTSGAKDTRGCYNGRYVEDQSLPKIAQWIKMKQRNG